MKPTMEVVAISDAIDALYTLANSITPSGVCAMETQNGGRVGSLTEAVVYAAENLEHIAEALSDIADAIRSKP